MSATRLLHIVHTDYLRDGEMLVRFSDGTSALYEMEELEKLRPRRKDSLPEHKMARGPLPSGSVFLQ